MGGAGKTGKSRSLGDLVGSLRPGGPCPWCGAKLKASAEVLADSGVGRTQPSPECGVVILRCPDCGAEVHDSQSEARGVGARDLGAAA